MTLREWLENRHPKRGARAWLMRASGVSFQTISRAIAGEEIRDKSAAEKLSMATSGQVSVADLMHLSGDSVSPSSEAPAGDALST
jgi:hypothetical protein